MSGERKVPHVGAEIPRCAVNWGAEKASEQIAIFFRCTNVFLSYFLMDNNGPFAIFFYVQLCLYSVDLIFSFFVFFFLLLLSLFF